MPQTNKPKNDSYAAIAEDGDPYAAIAEPATITLDPSDIDEVPEDQIVIVKPPNSIQSILDPLPVDRSVKADAWDAWHNAKTPQEFKAAFDKLNIPREAKADLWDAKFPKPLVLDPSDIDEVPEDQLVIKQPAKAAKQATPDPDKQESTLKKVARGATIGAFEGVGVKPALTPGAVLSGTAKQFGQSLNDQVEDSFRRNEHDLKLIPGYKNLPQWMQDVVASPLATVDLLPTFINNAANSVEAGFREASAANKRGDAEGAAEATASTLAQLALLRRVKDSAAALEDAKKSSLADKGQAMARKVTEARQAAKDAVVKAIKQYSDDVEKNKAARTETIRGNLERSRAARTEIDKGKLEVADENRRIEAENKTQAQAVAKRGQMAQEVDRESVALGSDLKQLEHKVWEEANRRMDAIKPVGNPTAPPDALIATVRNTESDILQGIPERIKEFNSILGMEGAPPDLAGAIEEHYGWTPEGGEPLTWEKLQSLKSRIDKRLRSTRGMNGDLKRALFAVRDGVVDEMGKLLRQPGQPPIAVKRWQLARDFYRNFKEDFHEPTGRSGSGSPIAQALDAVDPKKIRRPFSNVQSSIGNRGIEALEKYDQFGGDKVAGRVRDVLAKERQIETLPTEYKPTPLKQAPEVHELPKRKPAPPVPAKPAVDVRAASLKAVEDTARRIGRLNAWDARIVASSIVAVPVSLFLQSHIGAEAAGVGLGYVVTKYLLSNALEKPEIANWIAYTPKSEIAALDKLPGREKVIVKAGLADLAQQVGSEGKKISVSQALRGFLGPKNINRLVRAGIVAEPREKKPGEQLRDLRAIQSATLTIRPCRLGNHNNAGRESSERENF